MLAADQPSVLAEAVEAGLVRGSRVPGLLGRAVRGRAEAANDEPAATAVGAVDYLVRRLRQSDEEWGRSDVLCLMLSFVVPRDEVHGLAARLLDRFGSVSGVIGAPLRQLGSACGMDERVADFLKMIHLACRTALREPVEERPVIGSWQALLDYLKLTLQHERTELLRLLFLDTKNGLIRDEVHARGTINHTPLYPREVIGRVLELDAKALIMVHNHPSGDPRPSQADVTITREIRDVLEKLDVVLHDHVIVGRSGVASMRALKVI